MLLILMPFQVSDGNFVDLEGVRDVAPWLKCERQLLKTTDKNMTLKGFFKLAIKSATHS